MGPFLTRIRVRVDKNKASEKFSIKVIKTKLDGNEGKLIRVNGVLWQEEFFYANGQLGYRTTCQQPETKFYYPDGKVWVSAKGRLNLEVWSEEKNSRLLGQYIFLIKEDSFNQYFWDTSYNITVFDEKGKVKIKGGVVNRQRDGEWIIGYENVYYLKGLKVSQKLFYSKPEELDPKEVLETRNIQLRASLLSKIGMERILQVCGGEVKHVDGDNQLIIIPMPEQGGVSFPKRDVVLAILKVRCPSTGTFYALRVPPNVNTCEEARQWTFGLDREEERIQFQLET